MKTIHISKIVLGLYILMLLWLVLFKFSFDIFSVVLDHQTRSLNLLPFAGSSQTSMNEVIYNFVVFIPFGLLLGVTLKQTEFWQKLIYIFAFSATVEAAQFVFGIGVTDITDIITNTFGGLLGLLLYDFGGRYISKEKQDQFIIVTGMVVLIVLLLLRFMVFRVRYN